jgi:hypothetical protein
MGFQREFDPAIGDESLRACVNDGALVAAESHALAVNATTSSSLSLPAGIYRVFLQGMSAAETIAMVTGGSGVTAALPTAGTPRVAAVFPGNAEVRLRVLPDKTFVAAISAVGGGTVFFVPVVRL